MKGVCVKSQLVLAGLAAALLFSGCTDWKKKYDGLTVEHQNLLGRYEMCMSSLDGAATEKNRLGQALTATQQQLAELQRQLSAGKNDTGFEGLDTSIDTIPLTPERLMEHLEGAADG